MSEGGCTVTYDHDVLGHLRGATLADGRRIEYLLDAANRRVGKRIDGTADPSGLPEEWVYDPSHKDSNGDRFRHPDGDWLDFHRGRPELDGWRGEDHWHHDGGDHLRPGDEIPDPAPEGAPGDDPSEFCLIDDPTTRPIPLWLGIVAGTGVIIVTLVEDVATGGLGIADDPATLALGVGLIFGAGTLGEPSEGEDPQ